MKISRLWKREKPLSLFNEPIAWPHHSLCLGRSPIAPGRQTSHIQRMRLDHSMLGILNA